MHTINEERSHGFEGEQHSCMGEFGGRKGKYFR